MWRSLKGGSPTQVTFELGMEQQRAKKLGFEWNKSLSTLLPIVTMLLAFAIWYVGS
jgi:hypothetical protein